MLSRFFAFGLLMLPVILSVDVPKQLHGDLSDKRKTWDLWDLVSDRKHPYCGDLSVRVQGVQDDEVTLILQGLRGGH